MTPLGLPPDQCRAALDRYRRALLRLSERVARAEGIDRTVHDGRDAAAGRRAFAAGDTRSLATAGYDGELDDLRTQLEVDVLARASGAGLARMSALESAVVEPTLRRVRELVERGRRGPAGARTPFLLLAIAEATKVLEGAMTRLPVA